MTNEKFSQGEWGYHPDGTIRNEDCSIIIANDVLRHNGYILSAAPDMYRALRDITSRYEDYLISVGVDPSVNKNTQAARAALAKAEGEV